jgi:hypothetical protein
MVDIILGQMDERPEPEGALLLLKGSQNNDTTYDNTLKAWYNLVGYDTVDIGNSTWDDETQSLNLINTRIDTHIPQSALSNAYTIALRLCPSVWENYRGIIGHVLGGSAGIRFIHSDGKLVLYHSNMTNHNISASYIPVNTWTTLVVVYNATTAKSEIYINGTLVSTKTSAKALTPYENLIIGAGNNNNAEGDTFRGKMKNIAVYDRALTATEVQELAYIWNEGGTN